MNKKFCLLLMLITGCGMPASDPDQSLNSGEQIEFSDTKNGLLDRTQDWFNKLNADLQIIRSSKKSRLRKFKLITRLRELQRSKNNDLTLLSTVSLFLDDQDDVIAREAFDTLFYFKDSVDSYKQIENTVINTQNDRFQTHIAQYTTVPPALAIPIFKDLSNTKIRMSSNCRRKVDRAKQRYSVVSPSEYEIWENPDEHVQKIISWLKSENSHKVLFGISLAQKVKVHNQSLLEALKAVVRTKKHDNNDLAAATALAYMDTPGHEALEDLMFPISQPLTNKIIIAIQRAHALSSDEIIRLKSRIACRYPPFIRELKSHREKSISEIRLIFEKEYKKFISDIEQQPASKCKIPLSANFPNLNESKEYLLNVIRTGSDDEKYQASVVLESFGEAARSIKKEIEIVVSGDKLPRESNVRLSRLIKLLSYSVHDKNKHVYDLLHRKFLRLEDIEKASISDDDLELFIPRFLSTVLNDWGANEHGKASVYGSLAKMLQSKDVLRDQIIALLESYDSWHTASKIIDSMNRVDLTEIQSKIDSAIFKAYMMHGENNHFFGGKVIRTIGGPSISTVDSKNAMYKILEINPELTQRAIGRVSKSTASIEYKVKYLKFIATSAKLNSEPRAVNNAYKAIAALEKKSNELDMYRNAINEIANDLSVDKRVAAHAKKRYKYLSRHKNK